jgi:hypothetical protein
MWMNEMHIGDSIPRLYVLALSFLLRLHKKRCVVLVRVYFLRSSAACASSFSSAQFWFEDRHHLFRGGCLSVVPRVLLHEALVHLPLPLVAAFSFFLVVVFFILVGGRSGGRGGEVLFLQRLCMTGFGSLFFLLGLLFFSGATGLRFASLSPRPYEQVNFFFFFLAKR